eukprot:6932242-Prorocentrum_lima.AAC.1
MASSSMKRPCHTWAVTWAAGAPLPDRFGQKVGGLLFRVHGGRALPRAGCIGHWGERVRWGVQRKGWCGLFACHGRPPCRPPAERDHAQHQVPAAL